MIDKVKAEGKIEIVTPAVISSLNGESRLESVTLTVGDLSRELRLDGLFIAIGHAPAAGAFASLVALDEGGYVIAGEDCKTSCPGIYTAGDCRTKTVRQLTTACGDGAVAALASAEHI